jgi:Domain of unknown function (DUF4267)
MTIAFLLAWIVGIVLLLVGIYGLIAPHPLSRGYGVHVESHAGAGFVRATAIRDLAIGIALCAAAYAQSLPVLVALAVAGIIVSIADFAIAFHHGPAKRLHLAHGIHGSGIVAFILILAMALFAIGR